jgi:hypothetical protein
MTMGSAKAENLAVDDARQWICREFARLLNAGNFVARVRIVQTGGEPSEAWLYAHRDNDWHKESPALTDRTLVKALAETLDTLAIREHADEWLARKRVSADYQDIEMKFHREKLETRLGAKLESVLSGILFHDSHDSRKDKRRNIRTPRAEGRGGQRR